MAYETPIREDEVLAREKTVLAQQRTKLAYMRTGLAFIAAGMALWKLFMADLFMEIMAGFLVLVGASIIIYYFKRVKRYREEEKKVKKHRNDLGDLPRNSHFTSDSSLPRIPRREQ